jgi:hypothetical protein
LLCLSGKVFAVADIEAKRIEVAVQESGFSRIEDIERSGGPDSLNRISASISGASAGVRPPGGAAAW